MTQLSEVIWGIAQQGTLKWRIEALVRNHRWADATTSVWDAIPIDELSWAVACNATVQSTVQTSMAAYPEGSPERGSYVLAVAAIPDSDLEYILFTVALPRLAANETIN